jgi:hypothetical protein
MMRNAILTILAHFATQGALEMAHHRPAQGGPHRP